MNEKPLTKRQIQAIESKNKIYDVAINLFKEKGYFETTSRDIAETAKVSQGLIFNYFGSKEGFINELFRRMESEHEEMFNQLDQVTSYDNLVLFIEKLISWFRDEFGYKFTSVILSNQILYNNKLDILMDEERVYYSCIKELLEKSVEDKSLITTTPLNTMMRLIIQSVIRGSLVQWCLENGEFNVTERALETLNYLLISFKK